MKQVVKSEINGKILALSAKFHVRYIDVVKFDNESINLSMYFFSMDHNIICF